MHSDALIKICGKYQSDDTEIKHDGTILSKIGVEYEEIKSKISFNITIELVDKTQFTGRINLELPVGNIIKTGTSSYEKTDFSDVIFKRN